MMTRFLIWAVLAQVSLCFGAFAQSKLCHETACRDDVFLLDSASILRAYGMLMTLPADAPCAVARVVVMDMDDRRLGETDLLVPGEQGRVRLGYGFAAGVHPVRLVVSGCDATPQHVRRITLNKASPDHGWRAFTIAVGI
jgi:hypothetical protein